MKLTSYRLFPCLVLSLLCLACLPLSAHAKLELSKDIDEQMSRCLDPVEYTKYIQLQDEFRAMRNPGTVKIADSYKLNDVVLKDKGEDLCKLSKLPSWVTALCTVRTIVDTCEEARKTRLRDRMGQMYAYYIRDHLSYYDQGLDPVPAQPLPAEIRNDPGMKYEHDKLEQIERMFQDGVRNYYKTMRQLEVKIVEYRNRCIEIPNLVGLTYDESLGVTTKKGFSASLIQQTQFSGLKDYNDKAPLIIYRQDPQPGADEMRPKGFAIKIWVRNDLKSLKADPPSWLNAKVGDSKSFVVTAKLLNGRKVVTKDKDCKWHSTDTNVVDLSSVKGTVKATGPGKAEIRVLYDHDDGVKLASHVVSIPVTVLAPPKPKRKLTSFKLTPPSVVDITIGGSPVQLTGVATFSDKPGQKFDVTKDCKPWTSDGAPDLTVKGGLVTAHSAKFAQSKHVIHAAYTYDGQTMKDAVRFRILGAGTGPGTGTGQGPVTTQTPAEYVKLSLSKTDVTMDLQSQESIRATALYSKIPQFIPKDVTFDPDITWSSSDPSIAEFVNGVITSKKTVGSCVITATFSPAGAKKPLTAQCKVTVVGAPLVVDFEVSPRPGPYKPGNELTFTEMITAQDKKAYDLTWYLDGREFTKRSSIEYTFKSPGRYTVRLVARHRITGVEDSLAKNIDIEHPADLDVQIGFRPEANVYAVGTNVGFVAKVSDKKGITEYRWYVDGEYIGSGKTGVKHKFTKEGEYEIKLGLRMGSNFDEVSETRPLVVGEEGIGVLGRYRNRFSTENERGDLQILSSYWRGGSGDWSKPIRFNGGNIGEVDHFILHNGIQADGYNTGFLVYVPRGRNEIRFKVFHFRWPENPKMGPSPQGFVHYEGMLPLHGKTIVPKSVRFEDVASRLCEVEWRAADGSACRVRIAKFKKSKTIRYSGVEDLKCEEGVYPPIEDTGDVSDPGVPDDEADTDMEAGELQLPFSDDFSSGLRNWDTQYIKPELSGGKLYWNDPAHRPLSTKKTMPFENVIIEFDAWCEKDGLPVRWENERREGYLVVLGSWLNTRSLSGYGPGNVENVFGEHIVFKKWQHYRIVRQGDTLKASVDGTEVLSRKITTRYAGRGTLRFHSYSRVGIDNVRISRATGEDDVASDNLSDLLVSGVYSVDARVSQNYPSTWTLRVNNGAVSGMSKWGCCPGPRNDPLKGRITGDTVVINRDCTGQGYSGPCSQDYTGKLNGDVIEGSFTMNGRAMGTWKLYLDSREDASLSDDDTGGTSDGSGDGDDDIGTDDIGDDTGDLIDIEDLDDEGADSDKWGDPGDVDVAGGAGDTDDSEDIWDEDEDDSIADTDEHDEVVENGDGPGSVGGSGSEVVGSEALVGLWVAPDGQYLHIYRNEEWWEVEALENKGPVGWKKGTAGRFDGKRFSILLNSRVHFAEVSKNGTRLDWGPGNYWSLVNASPSAQDIDSHSFQPFNLAGSWVSNDGHKINLSQSGSKLTATALENKGPVGWKTAGGKVNFWDVSMLFGSRAYFGKVSEDGSRIDWGGGNVWSRKRPPSQGPTGPFIPYDQQGTNKLKITGYGIKKR